jgi:hypothetical protein
MLPLGVEGALQTAELSLDEALTGQVPASGVFAALNGGEGDQSCLDLEAAGGSQAD